LYYLASRFRMKDLESKLAERDAMIRVLQKHTYEKDVSSSSYQSMLGRSPHHTPHPSLHGNSDLGAVLGTSVSREELGKKWTIIYSLKWKSNGLAGDMLLVMTVGGTAWYNMWLFWSPLACVIQLSKPGPLISISNVSSLISKSHCAWQDWNCTSEVTVLTGRYCMNSQWQGHVEELDMLVLTFKRPGWYLNFTVWVTQYLNIIWKVKDKIMT